MTETESMVERVAKAMIAAIDEKEAFVRENDGICDVTVDGHVDFEALARAAIEPVTDHAVAIMEARLPLYTDIAARNAIKECISSIKASAIVKALEE